MDTLLHITLLRTHGSLWCPHIFQGWITPFKMFKNIQNICSFSFFPQYIACKVCMKTRCSGGEAWYLELNTSVRPYFTILAHLQHLCQYPKIKSMNNGSVDKQVWKCVFLMYNMYSVMSRPITPQKEKKLSSAQQGAGSGHINFPHIVP